jgi:hypothetical protein
MPVAVTLGRVHKLLDLGLRQVFPTAKVAVWASPGRDCSFFGGRSDQLEVRFSHVFGPPRFSYWSLTFYGQLQLFKAADAQPGSVSSAVRVVGFGAKRLRVDFRDRASQPMSIRCARLLQSW